MKGHTAKSAKVKGAWSEVWAKLRTSFQGSCLGEQKRERDKQTDLIPTAMSCDVSEIFPTREAH